MHYTVYLDESGTHAGAQSLVVAGYVAPTDDWITFETEWQACLAEYGIESFHMADFANKAYPFAYLEEDARENCLERLTSLIFKYAWGGYGVFVPLDIYRQAVSPSASRIFGGPYGLAAMRCFFEIADSLSSVDPAAEISCVMDRGVKGRGQILKAYALIRQQSEWRMQSLSFEDDRRFSPLQASDILAYELYREYTRQVLSKGFMRHNLERLCRRPIIGGLMSQSEMASWSKIASVASIWNPNLTPKRARQLRKMFGS
jgi:hypothetical protein